MKRSKAQFSRLLELDRQIRSGGYPNCLTFSIDWEVSQKTIQRDVDFLRDSLKAPVDYDRVKKGFYYTDPNWLLPAINLTEGELVGLLMSVRLLEQYRGSPVEKNLQSIASKIEELLPEEVSIRPELLFSQFSVTMPPAKPVNDKIWVPIIRGLQGKRALRIKYRAFDSEKAKDWTFRPYHLSNLQGDWYVFGSSVNHDDVLQLPMSRIESVRLMNQSFVVPADFDIDDVLSTTFCRAAAGGTPQKYKLVFDRSVATWVTERQWHPEQKIRKMKDGRVEMTFEASGECEVLRWVLSWGGDVKVMEPSGLKRAVLAEAKRIINKGHKHA